MPIERKRKRRHPPTPLGLFLNKYKISTSRLIDLCEGLGQRATMSRLVNQKLAPDYERVLHTALARTLPPLLFGLGLDKSQIDAELSLIFKQGEYEPMIARRIELRPDECTWFGLTKDPFTEFPARREDVFLSPALRRVLDRVIDALRYPAFLAVTGEIGSGKDVLRAMIEEHVAAKGNIHVIWPEFMDQAKISPIQIARAILRHFGYGAIGGKKIPSRAEDLGYHVKKCLKREFETGSRVTLALNECHHIGDSSLASLKNFFEMGSGGFQRWMSVLLIGQPSFASTDNTDSTKTARGRLYSEKFRELAERVILVEMPGPVEFRKYAADYMLFRLERAGASNSLFDEEAIRYITQQAVTPQQLGNIANSALRISKEEFNNKRVIGSAIQTKMFFENTSQGFKQRKAA